MRIILWCTSFISATAIRKVVKFSAYLINHYIINSSCIILLLRFEKLKGDELKALCRAAKLPVSGTNAELCERLCQGELSAPYTYEYAPEKFSRARFEYEMVGGYWSGGEYDKGPAPPPAQQGSKRSIGYSNENLKQMCKEKGLQVSGKRYELVLRLLQNESGFGGAPKRVAVDEGGQPKKRAKSMKLPNIEKIEERVSSILL